MNWWRIVTIAVAVALIVGGAVWAYQFFEAPEHIDDITAKWSESGHANEASISFTYWNENDPPEVPVNCAKCHSLYGYLDFLGADGTTLREVNNPARVGSVLYCNGCHNEVGHTLDSVVFPGGAEVTGMGRWANCMRCHQGRTSTQSVRQATEGLGPDEVSEDLQFINVHYGIAAATRHGSEVSVGYEYEGRDYVGFYPHVPDYDACTECHDPHSTAIDAAACQPCHANVVAFGDIFTIRETDVDYDGDGNVSVGILQEINTLHSALYTVIQQYAADVVGTPIVYTADFPYWAIDSNGNGQVDEGEAGPANRYNAWTPRLLRAAYNYHYVIEDPGGFTHNARYILQLIYDAIQDLGEQVDVETGRYVRPESTY
jgi:hypothetical protein